MRCFSSTTVKWETSQAGSKPKKQSRLVSTSSTSSMRTPSVDEATTGARRLLTARPTSLSDPSGPSCLVPPFLLAHYVERCGVSNGHHRHHTRLNGVRDDQIGHVGHTAGHVQRDHGESFVSNFFDRSRRLPAPQRAGKHAQAPARQANDSANRTG